MQIHLLDMGRTKYGDCVLVTQGQRSILIDAAHPGDTSRIRSQLRKLLGHEPPFVFDLLVVTHCHSDHIGCLPALVEGGDLTAATALVADERLGWGRSVDGDSPLDAEDLTPGQRALAAALQEEDHSDLSADELERFLQDAAKLEDTYRDMLERLAEQGTNVVRFGRDPDARVRQIEADFAGFGLKVLGPTPDQLVRCAHAIDQATDAIIDAVLAVSPAADAPDLTEAYRRLARRAKVDAMFAADQPGVGAAKNNQSIVLKVHAEGWSALLAADMQLAKAEVPGLSPLMTGLRQAINAAGPYDFIKLTHHTSYNGLDDQVLADWSQTTLFAHSGGWNDAGHPDHGVLELLEGMADRLTFARTDRNGIITVVKDGNVQMTVSRGELNDFTPNQPPDVPEPAARPKREPGPTPVVAQGRTSEGDVVEVIARVPHTATQVTLTIQVQPGGTENALIHQQTLPDRAPEIRLAGGRKLPKLLFVTCRPQLEDNVGQAEAVRVLHAIESAPLVELLDLPAGLGSAEQAAPKVRTRLAGADFRGVVILGGLDVVPAHRLDVLDRQLRDAVRNAGFEGQDADDFIVWSDELYGDQDGDFIPEIPVSRIPDGRRADVVMAALQAAVIDRSHRFGIRNVARPFAEQVFPHVLGAQGELLVSEPCSPADVPPGAAAGGVYLMLHGSSRDGARFWGETQGGAAFEAIAVENIPDRAPGSVVMTGCCWGALTASPAASELRGHTRLQPRSPETSMAVAYLRAGVLAFVGCTGSHYSPTIAPYDYYGKPMHDAFWAQIRQGSAPAEALFLAKKEFARRMPHGHHDPFSRAIEVKILRQFTCLGLGW